MKRIIYSVAVFLWSQFLLSCTSCGCKRTDNHVNSHFDIQGMSVGFSDKQQAYYEYSSDTSIRNFAITQDSAVLESDKFSLLVLFKLKYVAQNTKFNFSLINSAYACSPIEVGQSGSQEAIDSFYIQSVGSLKFISYDVDTFFTLNHLNTLSVYRNDSIFSLPITSNNGGIGTNGTIDYISNNKIYFRFSNSISTFITNNEFVRFRIVLKLKNGERYEALTTAVKLI